jgi:uncharacterized protein YjeT (DUF2065 family)
MSRTRLSLFYLVGYLVPSGLALLLAPQLTLKLLFSNGSYGEVMPRLVGLFVLILGLLAAQIVRHQVEGLYTTLVGLRLIIIVVLLGLFVYSSDPLFIVLMLVVGLGVVLTTLGYWLDRQTRAASQHKAA